jgi:hypothetical protein
MTKSNIRLGQVEPRERAGAQTGRKYEYQYERTARAALDMLAEGTTHVCVYCDWHDDFVTEVGQPPTKYVFHQVKGRASSQGPWTFSQFFGVAMRTNPKPTDKPATINKGAVAPLLFAHHRNFEYNCAGLYFVTNSGIDPALTAFLQKVAAANSPANLPVDDSAAFNHLARAYEAASPPVASSAAQLFEWMKALVLSHDQGNLENYDAALLELASVITEYSEIDLVLRQAKQIAREVVSCIRLKVAHSTTSVPACDKKLRDDKGVVVVDLLRLLSLSTPAYEALQMGAGQDSVKTLSRLHRYCAKRPEFTPHLTQICLFKAQWDIWRTTERHFLDSADFISLQAKARSIVASGFPLDKVINEAKDVAKQFENVAATALKGEHVLGLVFAIAAESEAIK